MRAGVYHENVKPRNSGSAGAPITFLGEAGAVIDGNHRITGWEPAPGRAQGVYKKSISRVGFEPKVIAYNGKYCAWLPPGSPYTSVMTTPQGDGMWDIVGAYGNQEGDTAYLRLRTGGDPDDEDVTIGGGHTIHIDGKNNITIRGFTIQNGSGQVWMTGGADGIVIEHNLIRGAQQSVFADHAGKVVIRNNDMTVNYFYEDFGHPIGQDATSFFVFVNFRHEYSREHPDFAIRLSASRDAQIYQNHVWRTYSAVLFEYVDSRLDIFNNYFHHCAGYCFLSGALHGTIEIHDNLIYEATEGWRTGSEGGDAVYYVYRNRFGQLTRVFTSGYRGGGRYGGRGRDLELYESDTRRYTYHNSFTGNVAIEIETGCTSDNRGTYGMPNTWLMNNIMSAEMGFYDGMEGMPNCNNWHVGYNWVGGTHESGNGLGDAYVINGPNNKLHPGEIMWNYDIPSYYLPANTDARQAGIDLSHPWTMDGIEHPALPGMELGYFSGSAPDPGAFQFGQVTSQSPAPRAVFSWLWNSDGVASRHESLRL